MSASEKSGGKQQAEERKVRSSDEDLKVVEPYWPPLEAGELDALFGRYPDIGEHRKRLTVSKRPLSAASIVETGTGEVFVKRQHPSARSVEDIEREHLFINHLRSRGYPTPGVFANNDGKTVTVMNGQVYEIQEVAEGEDVYGNRHTWSPFFSLIHAESAGAALARLHQAAADFPVRTPRPHHPMTGQFELAAAPDLICSIEKSLEDRPALADFLNRRPWRVEIGETYEEFHRELYPQLASLPRWYTHSDWQANNLFYSGDEVSSVIDFHVSDYTYRLYDVAVGIERNTLLWLSILEGDHSAVRYDQIEAFLQGYESVQSLSAEEYRALPDLLPVVQLDFALSGIDYYWGVEGNETRGSWGYEVFVLAHTRWFKEPAGKTLRAFLRERAKRFS